MQYGIDPAAFAIAIIAFVLAWIEARRNNRVILKVRKCDGTSKLSVETGWKPYHEFEIWLQNRGISLHDVTVILGFQAPGGSGWCDYPLCNDSKHSSEDSEFARGMMGRFYLNSTELKPGDAQFFQTLKTPIRQRVCLTVYAQGYKAYEIRIGGMWERMKSRWNRFAYWFNDLFTHSHGPSTPPSPPGTKILHTPKILPQFVTVEPGIMYFINAVGREEKRTE